MKKIIQESLFMFAFVFGMIAILIGLPVVAINLFVYLLGKGILTLIFGLAFLGANIVTVVLLAYRIGSEKDWWI